MDKVMGNPMDKVLVNFQVPRHQRRAFRLACYQLGTTMSAVLRDAISATIAEAGKGKGDE